MICDELGEGRKPGGTTGHH